MEMRERIKAIRTHKSVNLTQAEFSTALGLAPTSAASWEKKANPQIPTESMRMLICKEFHVNRHWLETGEGEMFDAEAEAPLNDYPPIIRAILRSYNRLNPAEQAAFCKFLDGVVEEYESTGQVTVDPFAAAEAAASDPAQSHTG